MKSLWNDSDAAEFVSRYGAEHGEPLALRTYTSQLIGRDPSLVLHGGGNTSVKQTLTSPLGGEIEVLCVKGSGHDLSSIDPSGFPALDLSRLHKLRDLSELSDLEMANQLRLAMLDLRDPTPSVEALLHAYSPHVFVDHTHANAVLELTNQPDGIGLAREALGDDVVVLPWAMPGFELARAVADAHAAQPECSAIVIAHHGVFTFGAEARTCYERMIEVVDRAETFADMRIDTSKTFTTVMTPRDDVHELVARVLPTVRGALAHATEGPLGPGWDRCVADHRDAEDVVAFSEHAAAADLVARGPLTPDHVIRTRGHYLWLSRDTAADADTCREAVAGYVADYRRYYEQHRQRRGGSGPMLDPRPRVVLIEGAGLVGFGEDRRAAAIAADIAEHTVRSIARAEALGEYRPLDAGEVFDMEYWPLELAKLGPRRRAPLAGQVGLVTGAAGAIGCGIAEAMLQAGCHVVLTDLSEERLATVVDRLAEDLPRERMHAVTADVCDEADVARLFAECRRRFGGLDVLVPNAGIAHVSTLAEMETRDFQKVLDVNLTGTLLVIKHAAAVFAEQRTGGSVVVQSSKNVFDPGAGFGAYSASKAGAHQLGKIAALELAPIGVSVNMINADAVFGDQAVKSGLWEEVGPDRMRARGLDPEGLRAYYRDRSLLKKSVLPAHVGQAVVFFASGVTPTTGATLPVDAGIPGAFPR